MPKKVEDLEYAMTSKADASILVSRAGIKEENGDALIETSRLRQLWVSLKSTRRDDEKITKRGLDEIDLDGLLSQPELDTVQQRFMTRYKIAFPPDVEPADTLVSRAVRELDNRLLSLRDISKVQSAR